MIGFIHSTYTYKTIGLVHQYNIYCLEGIVKKFYYSIFYLWKKLYDKKAWVHCLSMLFCLRLFTFTKIQESHDLNG